MLHRANTTDGADVNHGSHITRNGEKVTSLAQVTIPPSSATLSVQPQASKRYDPASSVTVPTTYDARGAIDSEDVAIRVVNVTEKNNTEIALNDSISVTGSINITIPSKKLSGNTTIETQLYNNSAQRVVVTETLNLTPAVSISNISVTAFDADIREPKPISGGKIDEESTIQLRAIVSPQSAADNLTYQFTQLTGPSARLLSRVGPKNLSIVIPPDIKQAQTLTFAVNASHENVSYSESTSVTITPTPERSLNLSKPHPEHVVNSEVNLQTPVPEDANEVAIYAKPNQNNSVALNQSDYGLVEINGQVSVTVNMINSSAFSKPDVILPGGGGTPSPGNAILASYGRHEIAIINVSKADQLSTGKPDSVLTAEYVEQLGAASRITTAVDVVPPRLSASFEPADRQLSTSRPLVNVSGDALGHSRVLLVAITDGGQTSVSLLNVRESGTYNETNIFLDFDSPVS
jgi:hypothetical protein